MFFVKDAQRERKKASRIQRAIPFANRTSLSALTEGMEYSGTVISLTPFGAYVDVGTTVDGLLHISQMSRETFVQHPKDILAPGDAIVVTVASINPEKKKLHLSMLSKSDLDIERAMSAMPANNDNEIEESKNRTYQIHKKYIVSSIKSGMMVIDQQRAHQRILYEQYLKNITVQQASSQHLLFPIELYFSVNEIELIKDLKMSLENTGFVFDSIENDKLTISGIPVSVSESEVAIVLEELMNDLHSGIPDSSFSLNDSIAKSMARSLAVRTGTYLTEKEQENIVNGLFACKEPDVSPFNKPTFITISVDDLDKKFAI